MPACLTCSTEFPEAPRRGPRPKTYCSPKCQIQAANIRRDLKRKGSAAQRPCDLSTTGEAPGQPVAPEATTIPPSASRALSDSPSVTPAERIAVLMTLAHSRGGIDPWQLAELAKLRGISPWSPARIIMAKDTTK
jgi:hypothetical protein